MLKNIKTTLDNLHEWITDDTTPGLIPTQIKTPTGRYCSRSAYPVGVYFFDRPLACLARDQPITTATR